MEMELAKLLASGMTITYTAAIKNKNGKDNLEAAFNFSEGYIKRDIELCYEDGSELMKLFDKVFDNIDESKYDKVMEHLNDIFKFAYQAGFSCRNNL